MQTLHHGPIKQYKMPLVLLLQNIVLMPTNFYNFVTYILQEISKGKIHNSPPNIFQVITLPCKILITTLLVLFSIQGSKKCTLLLR